MNNYSLIEIKALTPSRYVVKVKHSLKEEKITVMNDTLLDMGLFKPREITKNEYDQLKAAGVIDDLKAKAIHFISYQPRLTKEVLTFLEKKDASKRQINSIIKELSIAGLLNDKEYIKSFVDNAVNYESVGPFKVKEKLFNKGANSVLVEDAMKQYSKKIEKEKLRELLDKECRYPMKKPFTKMVQVLKQKMITKGFSIDVVETIVGEYKETIKSQIDEDYLLDRELQKIPRRLLEEKNKQKLIAKLMRLGYSYSLIKEKIKGGNFDEINE